MKNNEWKKLIGVVGTGLLAYLLFFPQGAWAGQNQKTKDNPQSPQKAVAQQTGEKRDGSHQGIKVHGHWTIEVRNPDGSLVTHREFENSYSPGSFLANILARNNSVGEWQISINGSAGPCVGFPAGSPPGPCFIIEGNGPAGSPSFAGLKINQNAGTLVLSGNAQPDFATSISQVSTLNGPCSNSTPPSSPCSILTGSGVLTLTTATLVPGSSNPPISVMAGQTVQVTVVISFS